VQLLRNGDPYDSQSRREVKRRLQLRAALNGHSMEAEARAILTAAVEGSQQKAVPEEDLGTAIQKLFAPLGSVELKIPPRRKSHRPIPTFD
jgi:plasmid stability protein